jgi:spore coat protein U-like protein
VPTPIPIPASTFLAAALLLAAPAARACTITETGGPLGTVNTQRVAAGPPVTGNGQFSFACSGAVLSALSGTPSLQGRLQASTTGLTLKYGAYAIPYQIYSDPGNTTPYTGGLLVVNLLGSSVINLLSAGGGGQVPIYIATTPGANIPAGIYTDTVQLTWTYANICEGLASVLGLCLGTLNTGTQTRTLNVTLTVTNDCVITAPPVSFGSAPLLAGFPTVSQSIGLVCSRDMVYTVGLSSGSNAANGRRRMAFGVARLEYDIFKADSSVWGSAGTARANGPAPATGNSLQTIPYTARIYTDQANPPAGTYTDNVVVDVSF